MTIIALVPRNEARISVHMTLCYLGDETPITGPMAQVCQSLARIIRPPEAYVVAHSQLGPENETNVAMLEGNDIRALWELVKAYHVSEWGFNPHISEQPGYPLPAIGTWILFDKLELWNDPERMAWRIGTGNRCAP